MMKTMQIQIRISEQEKKEWQEAAESAGMSVSEWLRNLARIEIAKKEKTEE